MINTKDNKRFFTYEKNLPQLAEFSKIFNAEISIVQIQNEVDVLELEELIPAFCEKKSQKAKFKIIEVKLKPKFNRKIIINRANKIRQYIKESLLKGETVSLKDLNHKYKSYKLTNACLCIHFAHVRKELTTEGRTLVKIGGGKYKIA